MELVDKYLKLSFRGQQNPTLNVGREGKFKRAKLFPAER